MARRASVVLAVAVCLIAPMVFAQTFHFGQPIYNTTEGNGTITISVIREGNLSSPANVFIFAACCSNTASYGSDYYFAGSQFSSFMNLSFAANETTKDVPIVV